jgi:AAA domain/VirE N-terminal domain
MSVGKKMSKIKEEKKSSADHQVYAAFTTSTRKLESPKVSMFKNSNSCEPITVSLLNVFKAVVSEKYLDKVNLIREYHSKGDYEIVNKLNSDSLPAFTPSGPFSNGLDIENLGHYNQIVQVSITCSESEYDALFKGTTEISYTHMAFSNPCKTGFLLLVMVDSTKEEHFEVSEQFIKYYESQLGVKIEEKCFDLSSRCPVSSDRNGFYNPESEIFHLKYEAFASEEVELSPFVKESNSSATYKSSDWSWTGSKTTSLKAMIERVNSEPKAKMIYSAIKENSTGLIYGVAKTGKTIFCENLGMSIASGRNSFLNDPLCIENKKVLFLSLEEYYTGRTSRNEKQLKDYSEEEREMIFDNYFVAGVNFPKQIASQNDWEAIEQEVAKYQPGIVFIDSLTRMVSDAIESVEPAKIAMLRLRNITEKYNTTMGIIHHSIKIDVSQAMTQQNVAGSRVISQETDFIIGINKTVNNQRYMKLVSARYADDNSEYVQTFRFNDNLNIELGPKAYESKLLSQTDGRKNETNADRVYNYFLNNPDKIILTGELKKEFVDKDIMSEPTLQSQLTNLNNQEKITRQHGKYQLVS